MRLPQFRLRRPQLTPFLGFVIVGLFGLVISVLMTTAVVAERNTAARQTQQDMTIRNLSKRLAQAELFIDWVKQHPGSVAFPGPSGPPGPQGPQGPPGLIVPNPLTPAPTIIIVPPSSPPLPS